MNPADAPRPAYPTVPLTKPPVAGPLTGPPPLPVRPPVHATTPLPPAQSPAHQPVPAPFPAPQPGYPVAVMTPPQSNAEIVVAWVFTALTLLYMLPWAVAATRRSTNSVVIAIATFFLGWTGLGWLVLLVLSFLGPTVHSTRPLVAVGLPPAPYPPTPAPAPMGLWAACPTDPPHLLRWWDGRAWTAHTTPR